MSHVTIENKLKIVTARITAACAKANRDPKEVMLLAVSKTKPLSMVLEAAAAGQQAFGENYLQDALEKIPNTGDQVLDWHFIGKIQSNKTKLIAENFSWVHTLCSEKVARRLNSHREMLGTNIKPLNVLIQVNIDAEQNKTGYLPSEVLTAIRDIPKYEHIKLRGLMAIPAKQPSAYKEPSAYKQPFAIQNNAFKRLQTLSFQLRDAIDLPDFDQLSIGMSADLELAIAHGSTIVRVGTDIFGNRDLNH